MGGIFRVRGVCNKNSIEKVWLGEFDATRTVDERSESVSWLPSCGK